MTNLIIQATDFGVEPSKAQAIEAVFVPMVQMLKSFETQYDSILEEYKKEVTEELVKKAKRLRLDIARVRIDTDKERKREKEFYLLGGRAVDGIANILKNAVVEKESVLSEIENHFENVKKEQLALIREERIKEIADCKVEDLDKLKIEIMPPKVFDAFVESLKKEKAEKNAKYLQFLKDNNFDDSKMEVRQIGTTFEIWEKKASITL